MEGQGRNERRKRGYRVLVIVRAEWQVFTILFASDLFGIVHNKNIFKEGAHQVILAHSARNPACLLSWEKTDSGHWDGPSALAVIWAC